MFLLIVLVLLCLFIFVFITTRFMVNKVIQIYKQANNRKSIEPWNTLDFVINRFFMKLFKTIDTVKHCQEYFGFDLPSVLWAKRMQKFEVKFGLYLSSEWNIFH